MADERTVYNWPAFRSDAGRFAYGGAVKNRDRVVYVKGVVTLTAHGPDGKPAAAVPIACYPTAGPPPTSGPHAGVGDPDRTLDNHDRGHLLALELGGPNTAYNVVPMHAGFNRRGRWRKLELKLVAKKKYKGRLEVEIRLRYNGSDARIPSHFDVTVRRNGVVIGDELWNQPIPHEVPPRTRKTVPPALAAIFARAKNAMPPNWGRALDRRMYPTLGPRPYEVLDYMDEVIPVNEFPEEFREGFGVEARRGPAPVQYKLVKWYNRWDRGNGFLVSDDPADPHQGLNEEGAADAPEIDHIVPSVSGGSNFYRNFRLVSWELNNKLNRIKGVENLFTGGQIATFAPSINETARGGKRGRSASVASASKKPRLDNSMDVDNG